MKALMLAVLEDGINSYLHDKGRSRDEAEVWVATPQRRSPFSFAVVCETLGLEPQAVRTALRRKREIESIPRRWSRKSRPQVRHHGQLCHPPGGPFVVNKPQGRARARGTSG